jgi:hypothetical protein
VGTQFQEVVDGAQRVVRDRIARPRAMRAGATKDEVEAGGIERMDFPLDAATPARCEASGVVNVAAAESSMVQA